MEKTWFKSSQTYVWSDAKTYETAESDNERFVAISRTQARMNNVFRSFLAEEHGMTEALESGRYDFPSIVEQLRACESRIFNPRIASRLKALNSLRIDVSHYELIPSKRDVADFVDLVVTVFKNLLNKYSYPVEPALLHPDVVRPETVVETPNLGETVGLEQNQHTKSGAWIWLVPFATLLCGIIGGGLVVLFLFLPSFSNPQSVAGTEFSTPTIVTTQPIAFVLSPTVTGTSVSAITPQRTTAPTVRPTLTPTTRPLPTRTPIPPPPPIPDTPLGSILAPGEIWRQSGQLLTLTEVNVVSDGVIINATFTNRTGQKLVFTVSGPNAFAVIDNMGNLFRSDIPWTDNVTVENEGSLRLFANGNAWIFKGNVANPNVTYVIFIIRNISRISEAKWRIPVYH
ncbi:MAG: hypothetical protein HY327_06730 [Chloroflexi bacterium]|nr:hypothetical protein [Chloroflexota bacterium]